MVVRIFSGGVDYFGVCYNSVKGLSTMFRTLTPGVEVVEMTADRFNPAEWKPEDVIVMPGGVCSIWDRLIGKHTAGLKAHVERGGGYLGVCAGAFYASSLVNYKVDEKLTLFRERELSLVKSVARGPLFGQEPRSVRVRFGEKEGELIMNGGGGFFEVDGAKLLAGFEKGPSAILSTHSGRVVLCQPHIEYCSIDPTRVTCVDPEAFNAECFIKITRELGLDAH